jgi:hypothetical protein
VRKREAEALGDELLEVWSLDEVGCHELNDFEDLFAHNQYKLPPRFRFSNPTYVNRPKSRTMSGGHILVECLYGIRPAHLAILLVHVVGAGSRIIANPDAEVLDLEGSFLVNDVQGDDLAVGLLDLAELHQEVPEAGLGNDGVGCEYTHAVELWGRVGLGRQVAPNDLVFCEATCESMVLVRLPRNKCAHVRSITEQASRCLWSLLSSLRIISCLRTAGLLGRSL